MILNLHGLDNEGSELFTRRSSMNEDGSPWRHFTRDNLRTQPIDLRFSPRIALSSYSKTNYA